MKLGPSSSSVLQTVQHVQPQTVEPQSVEPQLCEPQTVEPQSCEPQALEPETMPWGPQSLIDFIDLVSDQQQPDTQCLTLSREPQP
jgi:hypothetical protein